MDDQNEPNNLSLEDCRKSLSDAKQELEKTIRERDDYLSGWQRSKADFLNYKKDENQRLEYYAKFSHEAFARDLLSVLDSFDLAMNAFNHKTEDDKIFKSLIIIKSQFEAVMAKFGVTELAAQGKIFDPQTQEAVMEVESGDPSGTVVEEIEKGYLLHGRLLRPAKVKISK